MAGTAADEASTETAWLQASSDELVERVRDLAQAIMMVDHLDVEEVLMDAGMDSLESVDMRNQLEKALPGIKLPGALVLEYPTVVAIARYLAQARSTTIALPSAALSRSDSPDASPMARPSELLDVELQDTNGFVMLPTDFPSHAVADCLDNAGIGGSAVLLTGATGFLGIHMLAELLECTSKGQHPPRVVLLVRAATQSIGLTRVVEAARENGITLEESQMARLVVIPTHDLSLPRLGIDAQGLEDIRTAGVRTIIHNAAQVDWFKSYKYLKGSNVSTTLELLRLAAELGAKFGYVSSISSLPLWNMDQAMIETVDNSWEQIHVHKMSGYSQTKWMSEQLCRAACQKGVAVSIFRMPFIVGNSRTGCMSLQDSPARIIAACVELGEVPVSVQLDCVAVDVVARVVAGVSLQPGTSGVQPQTGKLMFGDPAHCCVHIATKFGKLGMEKIFEQLHRCGYHHIRWKDRSEWVQKALQQRTSAAPIQVFDRLFNRPPLVNSMSTETLQALGIRRSEAMEVTQQQLTAMVRFLQAKNMLPVPSQQEAFERQASPSIAAGEEMPADLIYSDCRRGCETNHERYHASVAARRNLHWYHEDVAGC